MSLLLIALSASDVGAQVPHDTCETAQAIEIGVAVPVDTTEAVDEGSAASCFFTGGTPGSRDVWFAFVADHDGPHQVSTCGGGSDTQVAVYFGDCTMELACNDDACLGLASDLVFDALAGETFVVQVAGWGAGGTVVSELLVTDLTLTAPPNDSYPGALPVSTGTTSFDTTGATASGYDPGCGAGMDATDIWFSTTAECSGELTLSLAGSSFDTALAVWDGSVYPQIGDTPIACNDDYFALQSEITLPVSAGDAFWIQVGGHAGATGSGVLEVSCAPAPADLTGEHVVVAGELGGGLVDSIAALESALTDLGLTPVTVSSLAAISGAPAAIYFAGGTFPDNHPLTEEEGAALRTWIEAGTDAFVSGGDIWGFDPPTEFAWVDGIDDTQSLDGDDSCFLLTGTDLLTGIIGPYTQDQDGDDYTDQLVAAAPGQDILGDDSLPILNCSGYAVAHRYRTELGIGNVLTASIEFGGLPASDQDAVLTAFHAFFEDDIIPPPTFTRGDANADGLVDIADPMTILSWIFIPGAPGIDCADAADGNDDDIIDIADATFILSALFIPSSTPIPAPHPACGEEPGISIGCEAYGACP